MKATIEFTLPEEDYEHRQTVNAREAWIALQELDEEMRRRKVEASQAMRARRLQRAMADNMSRLAAANPQLYNQLLVGRMLPQGAVVIGGGQRSDFLDSVAYQMAIGGFESPQTSPDSSDTIRNLVASY